MRLRWLALGDSYTHGEGVPRALGWPAELKRRLRREAIALRAPRLIARTGWTSEELLTALKLRAPRGPYALITLGIGVNDQYRGHAVDRYVNALDALLARAIALLDGRAERLLLPSIPDWGVTPFARQDARSAADISAQIDAFNAAARACGEASGARFIDITALSRAPQAALAADQLHPGAAQYRQWAAAIAPFARTALQR
jgi:lysophospholipase L1-like esterase